MSEQIGLSISEACVQSGIGRTMLYQLIKRGDLPAHKIGRRTIICPRDLEQLIQSSPRLQPRP
jgi:excisionase family DNA binding protein